MLSSKLSNIEKRNYLRIKTSGDIDFDKQIYLYNLNDTGKPGFEVINPIKIGNENYLVNRGWIPFEKKDLPEINLVDSGDNPDYRLRNQDGTFRITDTTNNAGRFVVNSDGHIDVVGNLDVGAGVDVTGDITVTGDVSIADTIVHTGDTNTKIRFPAGDVISFETSGAEALRIDSSQRISIGTTDVPGTGVQMDLRKSSDTTVYSATANQPNGLSIFNPSGVDGGFSGIQIGSTSSSGHFGSTILKNVSVTTGYSSDFVVQTRHQGNYGERLRVRSEGGLTFNGDTAAANALSDYEEGTWTPSLTEGSNSVSLTGAQGRYVKIGEMVYAFWRVDLATTSAGGHLIMSGLPFTHTSTVPACGGTAKDYQNYDIQDGPIYHLPNGQTNLQFYKNEGNNFNANNGSGKSFRACTIYSTV